MKYLNRLETSIFEFDPAMCVGAGDVSGNETFQDREPDGKIIRVSGGEICVENMADLRHRIDEHQAVDLLVHPCFVPFREVDQETFHQNVRARLKAALCPVICLTEWTNQEATLAFLESIPVRDNMYILLTGNRDPSLYPPSLNFSFVGDAEVSVYGAVHRPGSVSFGCVDIVFNEVQQLRGGTIDKLRLLSDLSLQD